MATGKPNKKDVEIVRRNPLFTELPDDTLKALLKEACVAEYKRGRILFLRGEPSEWFYFIIEGWVKVFRDTPDGEQTVISVMEPGETIAEAAIFLGNNCPASAEVVKDARLVKIPAKTLLCELRGDPELAIKMLGSLSARLKWLVHHIEQLQALSTSQRLGDFLLGLYEGKKGGECLQLPHDKSLIAARLGMKPESLSRALSKLKDVGVTSKGHTVELGDIDALRAYCQAGKGGNR